MDVLAELAYGDAADRVSARIDRLEGRALAAHNAAEESGDPGKEREARELIAAANWVARHPARGNLEGPPLHELEGS